MDEYRSVNSVELCGVPVERPVFSHISRSEKFFQFPMEIQRLSGAIDKINIIAREELLTLLEIPGGPKMRVVGELRSYNNKSGKGSRLVITVFAREICFDSGDDINKVSLVGTICKTPTLRSTPMGREICDLMVAVNRRYGRSDYLPCIAWGPRALAASQWTVGTVISLTGRIQSRNYIKNVEGEAVEKTAYEVSVMEVTVEKDAT